MVRLFLLTFLVQASNVLLASLAFAPTPSIQERAASTSLNAELFKAGLLANCEEQAANLASKKIKSVGDLGWKGTAKRRGGTRPRHWAFGGAGELSVQDKPNYDPTNPMCVEPWLSLEDFYAKVGDDTAVADTIFVALAKGGSHIEREKAEEVIDQWRISSKFDQGAFIKTVQQGRVDFLAGWAAFLGITGFAGAGIIFPTNPLQTALVNFLDSYLTVAAPSS